MYFTTNEKKAIFKVAKMMMVADDRVDAAEIVFSAMVVELIGGMNEGDMVSSNAMANDQALRIISDMDYAEKRLVAAILGTMMSIDGDINGTELAIWKLISSCCNLPGMTTLEASEIIKNAL